jgi:drug/metabolite transporter (DMT)-like permease
MRGVWAALGAGILWGTMYIPYRKAYLSGMNPLSFVTFFTFGELGMMATLTVSYLGFAVLWHELVSARAVLFWLMAGGFIWVIGDLFQQYAAKYLGISRGIPLSNSNQLWGLLWGIFVFGELHGSGASTYMQVIGGSLLMMLGVAAIAFSSATGAEQVEWAAATERECQRYGMDTRFVAARMQGEDMSAETSGVRRPVDWIVVALATGVFVYFGTLARAASLPFRGSIAALLSVAILILLVVCGSMLWRTTRFN